MEVKEEATNSDLNPSLGMVKGKSTDKDEKQSTISEFTEKGWFDYPQPAMRQKIVDQSRWMYATRHDLAKTENGYFHDFVATL